MKCKLVIAPVSQEHSCEIPVITSSLRMQLLSATSTRIFLVPLMLFVVSCSKEKTQREQYEDMTSGFTYKTYKVASQASVPPTVVAYNHELPDSISPMRNEYAHLLLGFCWTVSSKPAMAFAES